MKNGIYNSNGSTGDMPPVCAGNTLLPTTEKAGNQWDISSRCIDNSSFPPAGNQGNSPLISDGNAVSDRSENTKETSPGGSENEFFYSKFPLFDSHAHYDDAKFDTDREIILDSLQSNGIGHVVDVGCSFESMKKAEELARKYDFIYFSAGIHPNDALVAEENPDTVNIIRSYLENPKAVAIGEIGLDYHWDGPSRDLQKKWFETQLCLAEETGYPVIIHDREAHGDTMELLLRHKNVNGILHSFSGSPEMAEELVKLGWYISFSGVLTFKNAAKLPEAARRTPLDRMLLETDCPYLAPHPHRGKRNDSTLMKHTAAKLAEIKKISYEEICRITSENAMRIYGIRQ